MAVPSPIFEKTMTSKFATSMKKANDAVFRQFKETEQATFTPIAGDAFETEASMGRIHSEVADEETGEVILKDRRITIPIPEATVPFDEGIVTVEGEDWVVQDHDIISGYVDLQCRWNKPKSKHHQMHKRKSGA